MSKTEKSQTKSNSKETFISESVLRVSFLEQAAMLLLQQSKFRCLKINDIFIDK